MSSKVSVVIPTYNCEAYIKEAIESALSQIYKDMEIIVVDDGSTDGTESVVKRFSGRLKYFSQRDNTGPSAARNRGIAEATGEYIAFLDHDDVWMPDKIEKQIKIFETNKNLALVYSNLYYIDDAGREMGTIFDLIKPHRGIVFEKLLMDNFVPTTSVLVKKEILDKIGGFREDLEISHDFDLYLRIAEKYEIDFSISPLGKHRIYPESASDKKRKLMLNETVGIAKYYRDKMYSANRQLARELDRRIAKYMFYIALWTLEYEAQKEAIFEYFDCLRTKAFDYKILLGAGFFIMPKRISVPLMKKIIKINRV